MGERLTIELHSRWRRWCGNANYSQSPPPIGTPAAPIRKGDSSQPACFVEAFSKHLKFNSR